MNNTISIITPTFNSATTLVDCLRSINCQGITAEHIIIDGGSKDNTIDIAKSHGGKCKLISESDNGIYDAMNKGISIATGSIIGILNSDDYYAHNCVLEMVSILFRDERIDSCYGDLQYVKATNISKTVRNWRSGYFQKSKFYWGWMPPHPTFFVRRSVYEKYGLFNLDMGSAADYELMLRFLVKHNITTAYIPEVLVKMRVGGVSNASLKNRCKANRMDRKAWEINGLKPYPWTTWLKPLRKIGQFFV